MQPNGHVAPTTLVEQLYYTWTDYGLEIGSRMKVRAASAGLRDIYREQKRLIQSILVYALPAGADEYTTAPDEAPVTLALLETPIGQILVQKRYTGEDKRGRQGNYFIHFLLSQQNAIRAREAIALWRSPFWQDTDSLPQTSNELDAVELGQLQCRPGPLLPQTLARHVTEDQLAFMIQAYLERGERKIRLLAEADTSAALIYGVNSCLPGQLLTRLTFSTYEPDAIATNITIASTSRPVKPTARASRLAPFDFPDDYYRMDSPVIALNVYPDGRRTPLPGNTKLTEFAQFAAHALVTGEMAELEAIRSKAEAEQIDKADSYILIYRLMTMQSNQLKLDQADMTALLNDLGSRYMVELMQQERVQSALIELIQAHPAWWNIVRVEKYEPNLTPSRLNPESPLAEVAFRLGQLGAHTAIESMRQPNPTVTSALLSLITPLLVHPQLGAQAFLDDTIQQAIIATIATNQSWWTNYAQKPLLTLIQNTPIPFEAMTWERRVTGFAERLAEYVVGELARNPGPGVWRLLEVLIGQILQQPHLAASALDTKQVRLALIMLRLVDNEKWNKLGAPIILTLTQAASRFPALQSGLKHLALDIATQSQLEMRAGHVTVATGLLDMLVPVLQISTIADQVLQETIIQDTLLDTAGRWEQKILAHASVGSAYLTLRLIERLRYQLTRREEKLNTSSLNLLRSLLMLPSLSEARKTPEIHAALTSLAEQSAARAIRLLPQTGWQGLEPCLMLLTMLPPQNRTTSARMLFDGIRDLRLQASSKSEALVLARMLVIWEKCAIRVEEVESLYPRTWDVIMVLLTPALSDDGRTALIIRGMVAHEQNRTLPDDTTIISREPYSTYFRVAWTTLLKHEWGQKRVASFFESLILRGYPQRVELLSFLAMHGQSEQLAAILAQLPARPELALKSSEVRELVEGFSTNLQILAGSRPGVELMYRYLNDPTHFFSLSTARNGLEIDPAGQRVAEQCSSARFLPDDIHGLGQAWSTVLNFLKPAPGGPTTEPEKRYTSLASGLTALPPAIAEQLHEQIMLVLRVRLTARPQELAAVLLYLGPVIDSSAEHLFMTLFAKEVKIPIPARQPSKLLLTYVQFALDPTRFSEPPLVQTTQVAISAYATRTLADMRRTSPDLVDQIEQHIPQLKEQQKQRQKAEKEQKKQEERQKKETNPVQPIGSYHVSYKTAYRVQPTFGLFEIAIIILIMILAVGIFLFGLLRISGQPLPNFDLPFGGASGAPTASAPATASPTLRTPVPTEEINNSSNQDHAKSPPVTQPSPPPSKQPTVTPTLLPASQPVQSPTKSSEYYSPQKGERDMNNR